MSALEEKRLRLADVVAVFVVVVDVVAVVVLVVAVVVVVVMGEGISTISFLFEFDWMTPPTKETMEAGKQELRLDFVPHFFLLIVCPSFFSSSVECHPILCR